jgi:hypothetical protein
VPVEAAGDLRAELLTLRRRFAEVRCNRIERVLSAQTPEVYADGLHLGRFEIRLSWERIGSADAYRVVALEPKPARANRLVTHPHVYDERLCEGSAAPLIHEALVAGRLCDFFSIVSRLLANYSPGRCYVEPEDWHLPACVDCAEIVRLAAAHCRSCGEMLCAHCGSNCPWCETLTCFLCAHPCAVCKRRFCWDCLQFCLLCDQAVCSSCRVGSTCLTCNQGD